MNHDITIELIRQLPQICTALGVLTTAIGSIVAAVCASRADNSTKANYEKLRTVSHDIRNVHQAVNGNLTRAVDTARGEERASAVQEVERMRGDYEARIAALEAAYRDAVKGK